MPAACEKLEEPSEARAVREVVWARATRPRDAASSSSAGGTEGGPSPPRFEIHPALLP